MLLGMGLADRDYHRMPPEMARPPSRLAGAPVVKWLMIINVAVYYVDMLFFGWGLALSGHLSMGLALENYQVWRLITFQFLHADGMHLLMNMIGLFFFGHFAEQWWGSRKFLFYYLATGVAGAALYIVLFYAGWFGNLPADATGAGGFSGLLPEYLYGTERENNIIPAAYIPMVGASAGIFGILACVAIIAPNLRVLLFFFIPMRMRTFAMLALAISCVVIVFNLNNAGGEAGHLGGAILGFILMKCPHLLNFIGEKGRGRRRTVDAQVVREKKLRPRVTIDLEDTEIDRILDKVNRDGLQSLTDEERDVLRRIAEQ